MIRLFCILTIFLCVAPTLGYAQIDRYNGNTATGYAALKGSNQLNLNWGANGPPIEPKIDPVTYLKKDTPRSLQLRIETLLHGVYVDIRPEYDHYGYEIRRYMAHLAGPRVLGNKQALEGQIINIENAQTVLKYWQEDLMNEIDAIEKEIKERNAESSIRSKFNYNRGVVYAFLTECQQWIMHNRSLLEYLVEIDRSYQYNDPEITFNSFKYRKRFIALFKAKEAARQQINEYTPFRMMIY